MRTSIWEATMVLIVCAVVEPTCGAPPSNPERLVGVWTAVSATISGRPLEPETVKELRLTLTRDRLKSERAGQVIFDSTYQVDATKDPPHIDMLGTGELAGKTGPGIYKLDGDTLTLCHVMPGKPRPAAFTSEPQSEVFLIVYRRVAAAP